MGRAPCCDKANVKKGPWSPEEDTKLKDYIEKHGTGGNWIALPHKIGLKRCGKSCRLRWLNYLRPNIKHGEFSDDEDRKICSLFATIGSRWSIIAAHLPGRTDNDIKNYWNTKLKKKLFGVMSSSSSSSSTKQYQKMMHLPQSATTSSSLLPYSCNYNNFSLQNPSFPLPYPSPYDTNSPIRVFSRGYDDSIPFPPNFATLIPQYANPNFEPASCTSSGGSCITNQIGYDQTATLCGFGDNSAAVVVDDDQRFMSADFGGFGGEIGTPLENSIEEIKQLIATDSSLNSFINMDEIKTEF